MIYFLRISIILIVFGIKIYFIHSQNEVHFSCEPETSSSPDAPPFPDFPNEFELKVEANFVNENKTVEIEEYYSQPENKWVVKQKISGQVYTYLYDNVNKDKIFVLQDRECVLFSPEDFPAKILFGVNNINGSNMIYSPAEVFKFGKNFGEVYKGVTSVRGILVDHWQACAYWADIQANISINYYFTNKNWITASAAENLEISIPEIPVRATVEGISYDNGVHLFEHVYEFLFFKPYIDSPDVFMTAPGVLCENRENVLKVPEIPSFFQTSFQTIMGTEGSYSGYISEMWYYFEVTSGMLRLDSNTEFPNSNLPTSSIFDYKSQIHYSINFWKGTCDMEHISPDEWTTGIGGYPAMHLINPSELFKLNKNFTYTGKRIIRNLPCDIWIGIIDELTLYEYAFYLNIETNPNSVTTSVYFPVQLVAYVKTSTENEPVYKKQATFDYFKFRYKNIKMSDFDVSICFDEENKKYLELTLEGQYYSQMYGNLEEFKSLLISEIVGKTNVYFTRISNMLIEKFKNSILVTFTLLEYPKLSDAPNSASQFNLTNFEVYQKLASIIEKQSWKIEFRPQHLSVEYYDVIGIKEIDIIPEHTAEKGFYIQQFFKTTGVKFSVTKEFLPTASLDVCAKVCLEETSFQCHSFYSCVNERQCGFSDIHIGDVQTNDTESNIQCDVYSRSYKNFYQVKKATRLKIPIKNVIKNKTVQQCSKICTLNYQCESFDFCKDSTQKIFYCNLYKGHWTPASEENTESSEECDHYYRNYLQDFQVHTNTTVASSLRTYEGNFQAEECAWRCTMFTSYLCRSFEICNEKCYVQISRKNDYNVSSFVVQNCDHYFRITTANGSLISQAEKNYYVSGYSNGEMVGLAIGMLSLGIFVALVGLFVFVTFCSKFISRDSSDLLKLKFFKKERSPSNTSQ